MQRYQMPLAIALAVGIAATAYAQPTEQVLKLPDQIGVESAAYGWGREHGNPLR